MVPDYSSTGESELVSHLIDYHQDEVSGKWGNDEISKIQPEAHYNHYGDRGVADLYIEEVEHGDRRDYREAYLYEVKSAHAVEQANGAGEILRQFKRMKRYFFEDSSRQRPGHVTYELVFLPTPTTIRHLSQNVTLYKQLLERESSTLHSSVIVRAPDEDPRPGLPYANKIYDDIEKNITYTRPDYAYASGIDLNTMHEVLRDRHER